MAKRKVANEPVPTISDLLNLTKSINSTKPSKSSIPVVKISDDDELCQDIDDYVENKTKLETLESLVAEIKAVITPAAKECLSRIIQDENKVHASVKLVTDNSSVTATQASKFCKIKPEHEDRIRAICGDADVFDGLFEKEVVFSFKQSDLLSIKDKKALQTLMDLFTQFPIFQSLTTLETTDRYANGKHLDPKIRIIAQSLEAEGLVTPIAMSLK